MSKYQINNLNGNIYLFNSESETIVGMYSPENKTAWAGQLTQHEDAGQFDRFVQQEVPSDVTIFYGLSQADLRRMYEEDFAATSSTTDNPSTPQIGADKAMKNTTATASTFSVSFTEEFSPASDNLLQLVAAIFVETRHCAVQQCREVEVAAASAPGVPTFVTDAFEETLAEFELDMGELAALKGVLSYALDRVTTSYGIQAGKQLAELDQAWPGKVIDWDRVTAC